MTVFFLSPCICEIEQKRTTEQRFKPILRAVNSKPLGRESCLLIGRYYLRWQKIKMLCLFVQLLLECRSILY